jgi:hypothetical protein
MGFPFQKGQRPGHSRGGPARAMPRREREAGAASLLGFDCRVIALAKTLARELLASSQIKFHTHRARRQRAHDCGEPIRGVAAEPALRTFLFRQLIKRGVKFVHQRDDALFERHSGSLLF